jgi:asparagine synthase (glutamine-hydrolysing)
MCGISLIASLVKPIDDDVVGRMSASLIHRGPDGHGATRLSFCHLGHTRLSVIDLESGAQPMSDSTGRYWITFNGEIYNYREIRESLIERGRAFHTKSDTEVVLEAFAEWGAECLTRFRGMFAFAIWDTQLRRVFAARDLFGEKPLYFAMANGTLLIGSELKAIIASGLISPRVDLSAVDAFLALGYVPPDRSVYRNISTLPPAHFIEWDGNNTRITPYWSVRLQPRSVSIEDAAQELRSLLQQAVRRQMVGDVPVGAFLSGGLDSSTVVAMMQNLSTIPIKTFSVGFGKTINELPFARAVARRFDTEHFEIDLDFPDIPSALKRMAEVYDEPFADSSHIPTYMISEFARRHVKVALSGDGGDEMFGGYGWYAPIAMSEQVSGSIFKWAVLRAASRALRERHAALRTYSIAVGLAARWDDVWKRTLIWHLYMNAKERRRLWGHLATEVVPFEAGESFYPPVDTIGLNRGFYFDLACYLPGDILVKVDRASMAHGLETRAPFLDKDVVEFALSLPANLKVSDNEQKLALRAACSDFWPEEVRSRGKQGFGSPYIAWLRLPTMQPVLDAVFESGSSLRRFLPGLAGSQRDEATYKTWILVTLGLWLERHQVYA